MLRISRLTDYGTLVLAHLSGTGEQPTSAGAAILLLLALAGIVGVVFYHVYFIGTRGQTIGKRAAGVSVLDINTGQPIGYGRALGRILMSVVSGWVCYLGFLWMLWDDKKQTWHDKVVSTVVVKA